jgi:hypothetical protein
MESLKDHERNYATHDLELELVHALRKWRHHGKEIRIKNKPQGIYLIRKCENQLEFLAMI